MNEVRREALTEILTNDRGETPAQRADRNWNELLQEFRVLQTGVQLLTGFLLTLPFQSGFSGLDRFQRDLYLVLVVLAGLTTAVMLAPIAVHRHLFHWHRKDRLVTAGHRLARIALVLVGALIVGAAVFVFDIVVDRVAALIVGGLMLIPVLVSLWVLPRVIGGRPPVSSDPDADPQADPHTDPDADPDRDLEAQGREGSGQDTGQDSVPGSGPRSSSSAASQSSDSSSTT